jgi:hypothetical protein
MRIATIQQYAVFTKYLTLLSFESFHIGLVREIFTPRQSTVNGATRGIRRPIPMMLGGLLSNLLWTEDSLYWLSDSEVNTARTRLNIFRTARTVEVSKFFIIWHRTFVKNRYAMRKCCMPSETLWCASVYNFWYNWPET